MIPKTIRQDGPRVATGWPLKLHRYEANSLPDPVDVLDCLILINDRTDGIPRVRVALSNGGSFDYLGYLTDIPPASQPLTVVQQAQPHAEPSLQLLPPPAYNDTPIRSELASLKNRVAELERIIDGLHQVAIERMKSRV